MLFHPRPIPIYQTFQSSKGCNSLGWPRLSQHLLRGLFTYLPGTQTLESSSKCFPCISSELYGKWRSKVSIGFQQHRWCLILLCHDISFYLSYFKEKKTCLASVLLFEYYYIYLVVRWGFISEWVGWCGYTVPYSQLVIFTISYYQNVLLLIMRSFCYLSFQLSFLKHIWENNRSMHFQKENHLRKFNYTKIIIF